MSEGISNPTGTPMPAADAPAEGQSVQDVMEQVGEPTEGSTEEQTEEVAEGQESSEEASTDSESTKELKKQIEALKKYKVKVDDKEVEVDENELLAGYQMRKASQKRFEEAARLKKEAEQKMEYIKKNPAKALEDLGFDVEKLASDYLLERIEEKELTPEQRKLKEYEKKLRDYEEKERSIKEAQEREEAARLASKYEEDYSKKIKDALSTSGLPQTPYTIKRMAQIMIHALEEGYELSPQDAVGIVREDYLSDIKELVGQADGNTLLSLLGKDVADKIRKTELAKVKAKTPPSPTKVAEVAPPPKAEDKARKPKKIKTMDDFRKEMEELMKK